VVGTHFTRASDIIVPDHLISQPSYGRPIADDAVRSSLSHRDRIGARDYQQLASILSAIGQLPTPNN